MSIWTVGSSHEYQHLDLPSALTASIGGAGRSQLLASPPHEKRSPAMLRVLVVSLLLVGVLTASYVVAGALLFPQFGLRDFQELRAFGRALLVGFALLMGLYFKALHDELKRHDA